jgi:hypothetical protein
VEKNILGEKPELSSDSVTCDFLLISVMISDKFVRVFFRMSSSALALQNSMIDGNNE